MPEEDYLWLPREDILQFEEIERLVDQFLLLGVDKVRLTGGEPLLRRDLPTLVEPGAQERDSRSRDDHQRGAVEAGSQRSQSTPACTVSPISLDTLQRDRFIKLARFDELPRVLAGIDAAVDPFPGFKIDSVIIRGVNDDEIVPLLDFAKERGAEIRFIEYMDVGGATTGRCRRSCPARNARDDRRPLRPVEPLRESSSAPADRYRLPDGTIFGIIASTTEPFCKSCDRSRLTADGVWYLCLYASRGIDLRGPLAAA